MSLHVIYKPRVTVISRPMFMEPAHLLCDWAGEVGSDGARLIEYAGRVCYLSYRNPARRSSAEYTDNILAQGHGSVLEHANYSLLIEGISRSCSHELVRHRAGFAYSQQSQRYVNEGDCAFVMPPTVQDYPALHDHWIQLMHVAQAEYQALATDLQLQLEQEASLLDVPNTTHARKVAREAARSLLPNATETKIVATANIRAWRHMLEMRASLAAEREIRRMAIECLRALRAVCPEPFSDISELPDGKGGWVVQTEHRKV